MIRSSSIGVPHQVAFTNGDRTSTADVPKDKGGAGCGFGPHELLEAALATCLTITVEMYAVKHNLLLKSVTAEVRIDRSQPTEVAMLYSLIMRGSLTSDDKARLAEAAANCPVGRTLSGKLAIRESVQEI